DAAPCRGRQLADGAVISDFFIARPVLANVLAILMMVVGAVALFTLPVAQYPDVVPPTVQVTTRYPGASARTVIDAVALPIEQQVNGVEGMIYMQSFSGADGSYSLTVTFGVGAVNVFGAGQYSMRIWLDPEKMRARALVPQDIIQALQQQSARVTAGQIGMPPAPAGQSFQYTLNVAGKLNDPSEFDAIIVKT